MDGHDLERERGLSRTRSERQTLTVAHAASDTSLETHHHWLGLQLHAPDFFDALLDLIFQGEHFGGGGAAAIHDGQRVLARDADVAEAVSAGESGVLDQPCRRNFLLFSSAG